MPPSVFSITIALNVATRPLLVIGLMPSSTFSSSKDVDARDKPRARRFCELNFRLRPAPSRHAPPASRTIGRLMSADITPKNDRKPPHRIVGAAVSNTKPPSQHAEEAADLVAEEGKAEQHGQPARAEHHRDQRRGRRHRREPQQSGDRAENQRRRPGSPAA